MENKINIAELLKDCPKGMELECSTYNNVILVQVQEDSAYPIKIETPGGRIKLTKYGGVSYNKLSKCIIFPKGKTTWEGFVPPCKFKDGDILISGLKSCGSNPFIFKQINGFGNAECYCAINCYGELIFNSDNWTLIEGCRFAIPKEKEKLFDAINANGYRWNEETKTLEKLPKFKVGDRIVKRNGISVPLLITGIGGNYYYSNTENSVEVLPFAEQDDWELVSNKFDITTLVPFESRVLVRSSMDGLWKPAVFGFRNGYNDNAFYIVGGSCWKQCIPYLNNEHLCGTTNDCDEFYKTW